MKASVYIETSIVSYLTSRPSRDLIVAGHQQLTHEWWEAPRQEFDCYVSEVVLREVAQGDAAEARKRLTMVRGLPVLRLTEPAEELANTILESRTMPAKAEGDALHVAVAAVSQMDFLLTWNCAHLANAQVQGRVAELCRAAGLAFPVICTPEELMGE
jgi:hypothetical protein